jgi:hypothetical protein
MVMPQKGVNGPALMDRLSFPLHPGEWFMKRFLFGPGLLAAVLVPGSGALAAAPEKVVVVECLTEQSGWIMFVYRAPANQMPKQQALAAFDDQLAEMGNSCIPGTLAYTVGKSAT